MTTETEGRTATELDVATTTGTALAENNKVYVVVDSLDEISWAVVNPVTN